ncbi:MAG: hypothetical protein A3K19_15080 [Lentisphaerae bacterium RIFOXYB12_FULL_65_16]|nr:MAG: hypothetical protein A3K18_01665 [Lentisphaerae bacterium RIFOXYA12_64_32]OGV85957.1 MAG: hypothetical protein A3K19_15080 [Lentisphaerae bacterium RIFOXYB12_FULL_65_16]
MKRLIVCAMMLLLPPILLGQEPTATPEAAAPPPQDTRFTDLFQAGKADFEKGAYADALGKLQDAFRLSPGDPGVNFYLGRAAFESGDFESAVMAFERILMNEPDNEAAKFQLACSYYQLGVLDLARGYFQEVLSAGTPVLIETQRSAQTFLDSIDRARRRHFFSGLLSLGAHYDSNVTVAPTSSTINLPNLPDQPVTVDDEVEDALLSTTAAVTHRYKFRDSIWSWKSSLLNYNAFYDDMHELDLNYITAATGPGIEIGNLAADLQVFGDYMDKGYDTYMRTGGVRVSSFYAVNRYVYLAAGSSCAWKTYLQDPKRDAVNANVSAGPILAWGKNRLSLRGEIEAEDATDGPDYEEDEESYLKYSGSAEFERRFTERIGAFARARVQQFNYVARSAVFDQYRRDLLQDYTAGMNLRLTPALELELSHTFTHSGSTIELYRYQRNVTSLILSYRF